MKCEDCRHTPNTQDCIEAFDCDCAPSSCTVDSLVRCIWRVDHDGVWNTDCGQAHVFIDGTPGQNSYDFCPYCGKPLAEIHTPNTLLSGSEREQ